MRTFFTVLAFVTAAAAARAQTLEDPAFAPGTNTPPAVGAPQTPATADEAKPAPVKANAYHVPPFETYQPIIDRMPFGKGVAPPPAPTQPPVDNLQQEQDMQALAA